MFDFINSICLMIYLHNWMNRIHFDQKYVDDVSLNDKFILSFWNKLIKNPRLSLSFLRSFSFSRSRFPFFSFPDEIISMKFFLFLFFFFSTHRPSLRTKLMFQRSKNFLFFLLFSQFDDGWTLNKHLHW